MTDLKLSSPEHDLVFENGDFVLTKVESESLAQRLKIKLLTFQGEWFLDGELGIPYYQSILRKGVSKATVDSIFLRAISEEPEVSQILEFSSSFDNLNRSYSLTFSVLSENDPEPIPIEIEL